VLKQVFKRAEEEGIPGGEALLAEGEEVVYYETYGLRSVVPKEIPWKRGKFLDLASITKPVVTAYLILLLAKMGEVYLEDEIGKYVPELSHWRRSLLELGTHTAGISSWLPLYRNGAGREKMLKELSSIKPGSCGEVVYSCPGYIALGLVIERVFSMRLREVATALFRDMEVDIRFGPIRREISVPTEEGNLHEREKAGKVRVKMRGELIWGEVHDGNSYYWGGDAGNAGAFSTAEELVKIPSLLEELGDLKKYAIEVQRGTRSFGWDTRGEVIFHHGFTGGTLLINPANHRLAFVYLNRTHPRVRLEPMAELRKEMLKITMKWLKK